MRNEDFSEVEGQRYYVEEVVGFFDVRTPELPFSHFTVKVIRKADGRFQARPNVFFRTAQAIEYTGGSGGTVEKAGFDAVRSLYQEIKKSKSFNETLVTDFVWMQWTPFGFC